MLKTIICVALGLVALSLAYSAQEYIRFSDNQESASLSALNILNIGSSQQLREIKIQAREQDRILDFMVWEVDREKLLDQAIGLSHRQVNTQPFNVNAWLRLLTLQYERSPESSEVSRIMRGIYKLDGWREDTRVHLSRYCVPFIFNDGIQVPEICGTIVANLPSQDNKSLLASRIGVSLEDLEVILKERIVR